MVNFRSYLVVFFLVVYSGSVNSVEYDYIIVGGGSAGATLASRLSENSENQVLLLEAGDVPSLMSEAPALASNLQSTRYDWQFKTEPQENACFGMEEKRCLWSRGKGLGGNSAINQMYYLRGNKKDYDEWAKNGNAGWGWDDVLPFFLKSEGNTDSVLAEEDYHNDKGELSVSSMTSTNPLSAAILEAGLQVGYEIVDFNGPTQSGFGLPQGTIREGRRCSTEKAFLRSSVGRRNLKILTNAFVTQILIDKANKTANGVKFDYKNQKMNATAKKEVVLSAGAINTPHLLMLSGVGPAELLRKFSIPLIADLPVGKNLQDQIAADSIYFSLNQTVLEEITTNDYLDFLLSGTGSLATLRDSLGMAFINSPLMPIGEDRPDLQLRFLNSKFMTSRMGEQMRTSLGLTHEMYKAVYAHYEGVPSFLASVSLTRPYSRGYITLKSSNPYDQPLINPQYLSHPKDMELLVEGMKFAIKLSTTPALIKFRAKLFTTIIPGCESFPHYSDSYLACALRILTVTQNQPVGTCKMSPVDDHTGVVDPDLKVKGIKSLRIVDASVIPTMVTGNTNAVSIMIAERAADFINKTRAVPVEVETSDQQQKQQQQQQTSEKRLPLTLNRYIQAPIVFLRKPFLLWF